jgi:hypothetical protein
MHTTADERALWMVVLGIGLVVCIVVIVLLWLLISIVYDIDERVAYLWTVTKRTAINTTGLYQFAGTASILRALREELLRHEKLLSEAQLTIASVVEIVALIVVLAIFLLIVARQLRSISRTLAEVAWGARAVERQLRAVKSNIGQVNAALKDMVDVAPGLARMADQYASMRGRR